jgi:hypothetical protein
MATKPDHSQPALPQGAVPPPTEVVETLPRDSFKSSRSNKQSFIDHYSVPGDETERALIGEMYELEKLTSENLLEATDLDDPGAVKRRLRAVVDAQKAMLALIKNLDRHRHGSTQKIIVDYGSRLTISPGNDGKDKCSRSDSLIEYLYLNRAENLSEFAAICRKRAKILDDTHPRELVGMQDGFRIAPDRRMWKMEFRRLAIYLSGHSAKMSAAMVKQRTKHTQIIKVEYMGDVPAAKRASIKKKIAKNDNQQPEFAIAKNVRKASIPRAVGNT